MYAASRNFTAPRQTFAVFHLRILLQVPFLLILQVGLLPSATLQQPGRFASAVSSCSGTSVPALLCLHFCAFSVIDSLNLDVVHNSTFWPAQPLTCWVQLKWHTCNTTAFRAHLLTPCLATAHGNECCHWQQVLPVAASVASGSKCCLWQQELFEALLDAA